MRHRRRREIEERGEPVGVGKWRRGEGSGANIVREHVMSTVFIKLSTMHNEKPPTPVPQNCTSGGILVKCVRSVSGCFCMEDG